MNMEAGGLFGSIDATRNSADGLISNLLVLGNSDAIITADQVAIINSGGVGIQIEGNLNQDIVIEGELVDQIVVGGSLNADIEILADQGLLGQVIINEANVGGAWLNEVRVADGVSTIILDEPIYSDTLSNPFGDPYDLGGGAVGLVPFSFNLVESRVANTSGISRGSCSGGPASIDLVHYGPVADVGVSGLPVKIERKLQAPPFGQPNPWVDVSSSFTTGIAGRVVTVTPNNCDFECSYKYRITSVADALVCYGTPGLLA